MRESKLEKERTCQKCKQTIVTTAAGIKTHAKVCGA
jgi:hypothetical protein